jgi:hypothetical protein
MRKITIEPLRAFALSHNEIAFAHLCTAAIEGEEWAVERLVTNEFSRWTCRCSSTWTTNAIRATDTTPPSGAIARSVEF